MLVAYSMPPADAKIPVGENRPSRTSALRVRVGGPLCTLAGALVLAGTLLGAGPAAAQVSDDCIPLVKVMKEHGALMQRLNAMNKQKQKDANQFCSVFQQLGAKVNQAIPEVEKNGSWCHVPDNVLPALKASLPQIDKAKGQACGVAAQQRKMMNQQKAQQRGGPGPLGGGDSVVGGPIRMPQGAL